MESSNIEIYSNNVNYEISKIRNNFDEFLSKWLLYLEIKESSEYTYKMALKQFLEYLFNYHITSPTKTDILNYKKYLEKKEFKPKTISLYLIVVRQFFKFLEEENIYENIAAKVKTVKDGGEFGRDNLTDVQAKKLLESIDRSTLKGKRDFAIVALMLTTGLRTIEVVRANVGDKRNLGNSIVLYIQGKGRNSKDDFVKLSEPVINAIEEYLDARKDRKSSSPLFSSLSNQSRNKRIFVKSISRLISQLLTKAGLKTDRITAHSLRHTAATMNLIHGGTIDSTQQFLRHKSINTTLKYSHHLEKIKNDSNERISSVLFS